MKFRFCLVIGILAAGLLRAQTGPRITGASPNATVVSGTAATLTVSAIGSGTLTYQWHKDGVAIPGATTAALILATVRAANVGVYTVAVTDAAGTARSPEIYVSMLTGASHYINQHPASRTVFAGDSLLLQVTATGADGMTYQWRKNGTALAGATGPSYFVGSAVTVADAGTYTVDVTANGLVVSSEPCEVTVKTELPPKVSLSSTGNTTLTEGEGFTLNGIVSGTGPFTYQWSKDGAVIPGATGSAVQRTNAVIADSGLYSLTVTNSSGAASAAVPIIVYPAGLPVILAHPSNRSVLVGEDADNLVVTVKGASPIDRPNSVTYQWKKNGVNIPGATNSSYYVAQAQPADGGVYAVSVSNGSGTVTSQDAALTVETAGARALITWLISGSGFVDRGNGQTFHALFGSVVGERATFSVQTSNDSLSNSFQWKKDGVVIPGATSSRYTTGTGFAAAGSYTVDVTGGGRMATSRPITFDVLDRGVAPRLISQPSSQARNPGESVNFHVIAIGELPLAYQWRKDGVAIPGATFGSYGFQFRSAADAGAYTLVVTNRLGSVTSATANVSLAATPVPTAPPVIGRHPASFTSPGPGLIAPPLEVSLLNGAPASYQWYRDGVALPGATNATLDVSFRISSVVAGRYSVVATNAAGSTTSYDANVVARNARLPTFSQLYPLFTPFAGSTVTLDPGVAGATTLQWRKDGIDLNGATAATLTFANVQDRDNGTYTLVATNSVGVASSRALTLAVQQPTPVPVITTHPVPRTVNAGETVVFSVVATGAKGSLYNWTRNGSLAARPVVDGDTLTLVNVQPRQAGIYACKIDGQTGSATSNGAELIVVGPSPLVAPVFATQPLGVSVQVGQSVTLTAEATGNPTPSYQWKKDGVAISGAILPAFGLGPVRLTDAGTYTVVATNSAGSATSAPAIVRVNESSTFAPTIDLQPRSQTVAPGQVVTFTAQASGSPIPTFQWQKNGTNLPGATSTSFTIPAARFSDAGDYRVVATNSVGSATSAPAVLTVSESSNVAPSIVQQPRSQTVGIGQAAIFTVQASGNPAPTFQWQKNGANLPGATNTSFTIPAVGASDAGDYRVIVTNAAGTVTSEAARLAFTVGIRLVNLSILTTLGNGETMTVGTVLGGAGTTGTKPLLVRAAGPSLILFGIEQGLPAPQLRLFRTGSGPATPLSANRGWGGGAALGSIFTQVGAFPFLSGTSADSALYETGLATGSYTVEVGDAGPGNATVLVELYDATPVVALAPTTARLINASVLKQIAPSRSLTAGFVLSGTGTRTVLIRAVGPTLAAAPFNVSGVLATPQLTLNRAGAATPLGTNGGWGGDGALAAAFAKVGAFALGATSRDAALLVTLPQGSYTANVTGASGSTGFALVEVYEVP